MPHSVGVQLVVRGPHLVHLESPSISRLVMQLTDQIRQKAQHLERRVARRNRREYVAASVVAAGCGWVMWAGPSATIRVGAGLSVAATKERAGGFNDARQ